MGMDQFNPPTSGHEDFREIIQTNVYYVDKTLLIKDFIDNFSKFTLFTRPRRFGKTLTMSMLKYFFENTGDEVKNRENRELFKALKIYSEGDKYLSHMCQYPVISLTLKGIDGGGFDAYMTAFKDIIREAVNNCYYLHESKILSDNEKKEYEDILDICRCDFSPDVILRQDQYNKLARVPYILVDLLARHFGKNVVFLIDEYDVPLHRAYEKGCYDRIVEFIRKMLGDLFKTNNNLAFGVLTGCLRVSKESIFTGLNNFKVRGVSSNLMSSYFGFTEEEVITMLSYYKIPEKLETVRKWYDGYNFGKDNLYCPWDVCSYVEDAVNNYDIEPYPYWINTSGNDIIRRFVEMADNRDKNELERLVLGKSISKSIMEELTYRDLYSTVDNMWSVMYSTGYLTAVSNSNGIYELVIPNLEIKQIFEKQIMEWFNAQVRADEDQRAVLSDALLAGDVEKATGAINNFLKKTISIRDTATKDKKENFYHGILLGILGCNKDWIVKSNRETGDGYSDIIVEVMTDYTGMVIEVKYSDSRDKLEADAGTALEQIDSKYYEELLYQEGMDRTLKYGIAFNKKRCAVAVRDTERR